MCRATSIALSLTSCLLFVASPASAQAFESVGSRALGMGGAFVAVADDASAAFWNPAGLASGQPAGGTIEWVRFGTGDRGGERTTHPHDLRGRFVSLGTWPMAVSYLNLDEVRLNPELGGRSERLKTSHFSLSLLQSLSDTFVLGTTLRYVRGSAASIVTETIDGEDAAEELRDAPYRKSGEFDLDFSAMFNAGVFRIGATMRNLTSPEFEAPDGTVVSVARQSRIGLAVLPKAGLTLAMDLDLETVDGPSGARRTLAAGGEFVVSPRVVVRAGARRNLETSIESGGIATLGASFAVRRGTWLDAHASAGRSTGNIAYGIGLRAGW